MYSKLMEIYHMMYGHFGSRRWWPADTLFEVAVGAILTQGVAWRNVELAIQNLKQEGLLDLAAMAQANLDDLARLIRPTLYYNMKAKKLQAFCRHVMENYHGALDQLFSKDLWPLREELLGIYGIGEETATAYYCMLLKNLYLWWMHIPKGYSQDWGWWKRI